MNILIVEDDDNIANVVSEILQAREFETVLCDTGSQAVELIKNNMYDLILLDLMLPGVDGFEICRKVRAEKNTPIIMVCAKKEDIISCIRDCICNFDVHKVDFDGYRSYIRNEHQQFTADVKKIFVNEDYI